MADIKAYISKLAQHIFSPFLCAAARLKPTTVLHQLDPARAASTHRKEEEEEEDKLEMESETEVEIEDEDGDEDELLAFRPTIELINFAALKAYALRVRGQLSDITQTQTRSSSEMECEIDGEAMCGSFNLVYALKFSDGCRWVARFPINSPNFGPLDKEKMDSEYNTARLIQKDLQLAIPDVFAWHTDSSVVGAPFALMSFVPGVSIMDRWLDNEWITEEKKFKILSNLAQYMAILQGPTFDATGALRFTEGGAFSHMGPEIHIHLNIEVDPETDDPATLSEQAVCHSLDEWMTADWDPLEGLPEWRRWHIGLLHVIRLALNSVPGYLRRTDRFVLEMVDYNYQNIFIDDDCNITGFIDWDGVRAVPQGIGATRYPSWITRDWEPGCYGEPDDGDWVDYEEDSPEQLSKYRQHYAEAFAKLKLGQGYDERETKLSHILEAIKLAAGSRLERPYTAIKLLHHAFRGKVPFTAAQCWDTLTEIESDKGKAMATQISEAFESMWHAEWEVEETNANNSVMFKNIIDNLGK